MKICFAASSGGHFEQILMLKPLMEKNESFILTEKTDYAVQTAFPCKYVLQVNRKEPLFLPKMLVVCFQSLFVLLKEKPDVIICTGALAMIPMCLLVKLRKGKLIYIESFAKVNSPNMSGKFLYRFADRFYVQWESMLKLYPKAIFKGGIY